METIVQSEVLVPADVNKPGKTAALSSHWRFVLLLGVLCALYAPVLGGLCKQAYQDPNYSHILFVPVFAGFLLWHKRSVITTPVLRPNMFGFVIVLAAQALLYVGSLGAELFLSRMSLLMTILGLVVYFCGWGMVRLLIFPMSFLLFMVPIPAIIYNEVVFPLQLLASRFATEFLDVLNIFPVLREGNQLVLPNYTIEVVEACSGIRSLMALLTLSVGYGYLAEPRLWVRVFLVTAMVPLAIVSNGLRVVSAALATHYWGPAVAEGLLHTFSGIAIFMFASALLLLTHKTISLIEVRFKKVRHG